MDEGRVLFGYFCLLYLLNQAGAAREVKTLNYRPVKDQRIRVRRYSWIFRRYVNECIPATSTSDGFSKLAEDDYVVQFVNNNGKFSVNVSWQAPQGK